ncbi:MAG: SMC family ATPase [Salinivirgaceae bacterium]|jgi:exonuclease SbcC|nr:SMC family ATPase [Salinivirgaceae bacterium]
MIPERLILKGIYSYQHTTEIVFDDLMSAGLFGIFGPVGSGKSAVLEAITFAMYGETERLNNRDSKHYNMMNLRSNEMEIDFTFKHQSKRYRFTAYARRNRNNFTDITKNERKAYVWEDNQWVPQESADATNVIGLKYEHFKQIVIIPQGKFNEFVQLSPTDRTKMMRELFPLDRFDLRDPANRLFNQVKTEISQLQGRLQEFEEYSPEAAKALEKEIKEHQTELEKLKMELLRLEKSMHETVELKKLTDNIEATQKALVTKESQKATMEQLAEKLKLFEKVKYRYQPVMSRLSEIESEVQQLTNLYEKQKTKNDLLISKIAAHQQEMQKITAAGGDVEAHKKRDAGLNKALEIKKLQQELGQLSDGFKNKQAQLKKAEVAREELKSRLASQKEQLTKKRNALPDEGVLHELRSSFSEEVILQKQVRSAENELKQSINIVEELKRDRIEIMNDVSTIVEADEPLGELKAKDALVLLEKTLTTIKDKLAQFAKRKVQLDVQSGLERYAGALQEGEPCPLCGAEHHPKPFSNTALGNEQEQLMELVGKHEQHRDKLSQAITQLGSLVERFRREGGQKEARQKAVHEAKSQIEECQNKRNMLPVKFSAEELAQVLKQLAVDKKEIARLEQAVLQTEQELNSESAIEQLQKEIQSAETRIITVQTQINVQQTDIVPEWLAKSTDELNALKIQTGKELQKLETLLKEIDDQQLAQQKLEVQIEETKKQQERQTVQLEEKQQQLNQMLEEDKFNSVNDVQTVLDEEMNIEAVQSQIDTFHRELHTLKSRFSDLQSQLGDRKFDAQAFEELEKTVKNRQDAVSNMETRSGGLQSTYQVLVNKLKLKKQLAENLDKKEKRKENLEVMMGLFRGDGFMRYVSQIYLQQLCAIANERFRKLTHNQLELDIDENYNFIIRDFLHDGRMRLLKTLSGGQTFQAALSLAMALSEQIQQYQNVKQQFFFMDEGFGSLDRESLSLVFDTLKQLRKEQRTVGVISHVEELRSEIDRYLLVENDEEEGSRIRFNG